jgi:hypothetical protein
MIHYFPLLPVIFPWFSCFIFIKSHSIPIISHYNGNIYIPNIVQYIPIIFQYIPIELISIKFALCAIYIPSMFNIYSHYFHL